jgi:type I restriction enzyme M protein
MLSSETKRRIDSCRDILVGQLPLPTDQVELITLALIYKFMDDLDEQSVQLGGKRSFFIKDLADFRWRSLMPQTVSAADRVRLFADGLEALGDPKTGKHLPEMFRDIFRNAMLKFRDGRILSLFLTELDGFAYSHSEELGNAFEYLLQSMGAQGDNGQFRTPRHIIDFIVEVLEPKPEDKILDPACGTGGFLVSAYKHILGKHTSKGSTVPGDELSPAKKEKLTQQLNGHDITPMMVKLSKVNMFLHGFSDPQIHEYDTLSNDARWNEKYDLIMANPPFMTPKGGVVPHTKFRIAAKKAEVLFTDYIAEHLSTNGRAGIIVPEGIIFQSANSYKALRKFLVEDSLVAVISLPAGVFNPYAGVKTSILILDKGLARQSDSIGFFKVENDGYDLGAQRRAIDKNDLPRLTKEIHDYLAKLRSGKEMSDKDELHIVPKEKLAANGEYNFSGERYRESEARSTAYPLVKIEEISTLNPKKSQISFGAETQVSFVPMADLNENRISFKAKEVKRLGDVTASYTYFEDKDVLLAKVTPCFENGKAGIARDLINGIGFGSSEFYVLRSGGNVLPEWLYYCVMHPFFRNAAFESMTGTGGLQRVPRDFLENFKIPLPPLEIQKEIVAEIEGYQKVIDGARAVVENYKPQIPENTGPLRPIEEMAEIINGYAFKSELMKSNRTREGELPVLKIGNFTQEGLIDMDDAEYHLYEDELERFLLKKGDVVIAMTGATVGKVAEVDRDKVLLNQRVGAVRAKDNNCQKFILHSLRSSLFYNFCQKGASGGAQGNISPRQILEFKTPAPSLERQKDICVELEKEQAMVNSNKELIARFEKKIQAVMDRVWGNGTAE